jgi:mannose-6-phosphate isomerase-like protein (cupin superfamily)
MLSRPTASTIAVKMRLEPTRSAPTPRVHPGHDWFFVIEGRVRLVLGDRDVTVETGEAAEFATMTPHAIVAVDGPAELIMIFDRDGQRAHIHHEAAPGAPAGTGDGRSPEPGDCGPVDSVVRSPPGANGAVDLRRTDGRQAEHLDHLG